MKQLKYVMFNVQGADIPVIFPGNFMSHKQVARIHRGYSFYEPTLVSAGFCYFDDGEWHATGKSLSTGLGSREIDSKIITKAMGEQHESS